MRAAAAQRSCRPVVALEQSLFLKPAAINRDHDVGDDIAPGRVPRIGGIDAPSNNYSR